MIKSGVISGKIVKILIDSGATNSLCRVGLGKHVIRSKAVHISGYDGLMSPLTETRELKETVQIGSFTFHDTQLTEWDLKDKAFDVILGQPWFKKHNPVIDWRKHDIVSVDEVVDANALAMEPPGWIMKLCHVQAQPQEYPAEIKAVLDEFKDVFPKELPDGLPPERGVQFDLKLKPDAKPQNRAPFRLAKVEQESIRIS
ncbi:hypothetical protein AaE_000064 [Aphanomyces astaci]|uniref:Peptidase A2 domain-containing protein n=1 Tax=Aphanomyces astaci TaxID=112090 RepID=A0A6A5AV80_APHAT|nr:hypothetical protein AaE_000064 [Aphanomyces astaci]